MHILGARVTFAPALSATFLLWLHFVIICFSPDSTDKKLSQQLIKAASTDSRNVLKWGLQIRDPAMDNKLTMADT